MKIKIPYNFEPRVYQFPLLDALDSGIKRAVCVWHRRSGKEKTCLNLMIKKMHERVGGYYYMFPELKQGRRILWDGIDKDGQKFLDHFPKEVIESKNDQEMKIKLKCGSLFQILGGDAYDSNVGANPIGIVFSEYSLTNPAAWGFYRPILAENGGWAIFNFTPRGENHAFDLYNLSVSDTESWFSQVLTVDDTKIISDEILQQEKREIVRLNGNDALYQQEYYCNFTVPIAGAYYAEQIMEANRDSRITAVPHDTRLPVTTFWDLGVNDKMSIWFLQVLGGEIRLIDYYENTGQGFPHYVQVLKDKGYIYNEHYAPHDIEVREMSTGVSRKDTAKLLGIDFRVTPNLPVIDGISAVRNIFNRCWFDKEKCKEGLNALKNYHKHYDEKRKTYLDAPYHDWSSNAADAFRYMSVGLDLRTIRRTGIDAHNVSENDKTKPWIPPRYRVDEHSPRRVAYA